MSQLGLNEFSLREDIDENVEYKRILKKTTKSVYCIFVIVATTAFLYGSRTTVWIEYASTFNDSSSIVISWIMYADALLIAIVGIFFSTLGDYIGFDKSITLKVLLITIGCVIEALAANFKTLCVGFLISQTAISYVALGYIAWILPTKYAKQQLSNNYAIGSIFFLIGPICSGIVYKIFNDYRIIFILNAAVMMLLLIFCCCFVWGQQKGIETIQISFFAKTGTMTENEALAPTESADENVFAAADQEKIFPAFITSQKENKQLTLFFSRNIAPLQFYLIISIITELGIFFNFEAIFVTYFVPFMLQKFDSDNYSKTDIVLFSTLQIVALTLSMILSFVITPKLYKYVNHNALPIISIVLIFVSSLCYLLDMNSIHWFWANIIMIGASLGTLFVILEYSLLDVMPPKDAGKINGIKALLHNIVRSLYLLFIGLYWERASGSMVYVMQVSCVIGLAFRCLRMIVLRNQ